MGTLSPASPQISPSDGEAGRQQDCPASGYFVVAVPPGCPPLGMVLPWQRHPKTLRSRAGAEPGIPTRAPLTPRGCSGFPPAEIVPQSVTLCCQISSMLNECSSKEERADLHRGLGASWGEKPHPRRYACLHSRGHRPPSHAGTALPVSPLLLAQAGLPASSSYPY